MIEALDHVAVAVNDLDTAATAFEALLGSPPTWREEAAGARHAWFQLANMAVDIVQPDGLGESGERVGARLGVGGEGLWGLAFAVDDLAETRRVFARRGAPTAEPMDLLSTEAWRLAFIDEAVTHGVPIALAQRSGAAARPRPVSADGVHALDHVVIGTTNPDRALALYGARLGLDFRLDRSNPQWSSRLLFFRCGDAVIEIAADLNAPLNDAPDRLSGLAWRVGDPAAARSRLVGLGLDASEVRPGRKPGTAVFTVRSGIPGGPALVIGGG